MSQTKICFCQKPRSQCIDCPDKPRCDYTPKEVVDPGTRICPECGHVNGKDDLNCEKCDYPLVI